MENLALKSVDFDNLEISPFISSSYFIAYSDSFRYGLTQGHIYTPRFYSKEESDTYEYGPYFKNLPEDLTHEYLHKLILELEGELTSKAFEKIDKNQNNTYILSAIGES